MFEKVFIDLSYSGWVGGTLGEEDFDNEEFKLIPFLYLIAEEVFESSEGTVPGFEDGERDQGGIFRVPGEPGFLRHVRGTGQGRPHIVDAVRNLDGVYFTPLKWAKAQVMRYQGITPQNSALMLAAAGLEVIIPNFTFDLARSDEIVVVKEKLCDERQDYLHAITKLTDETYERLTNGTYKDTVQWALSEAFLKIRPKAEDFERKMKKLDKKLLQRLSLDFVKDGIPAIGSVAQERGVKSAAVKAIEVVLETLCTNLARSIEERKVPEVVYGYKLSKLLK